MIDIELQIGECPKCGKRTFVVYKKQKTFGISIKGKCYNCEESKEFDY